MESVVAAIVRRRGRAMATAGAGVPLCPNVRVEAMAGAAIAARGRFCCPPPGTIRHGEHWTGGGVVVAGGATRVRDGGAGVAQAAGEADEVMGVTMGAKGSGVGPSGSPTTVLASVAELNAVAVSAMAMGATA